MLILCVIQALKLSQATTGDQAAQIRTLRREVTVLREQLEISAASLASVASKKRIDSLAFEGADQVTVLGKKFATTEALWIEVDIFDLPNNFKDHPDTPGRFENDDSYNQGTVKALYALIPEHLHKHMADKKEFKSNVRLYFLLVINCLMLIILCSVYRRM